MPRRVSPLRLLSAVFFAIVCSPAEVARAQPSDATSPPARQERFRHITRTEIPRSELALNFAALYATQWIVYGVTQHETIRDHGSFHDYTRRILSPHFDRDNLENNVIRHTLAGSSYYLFYRSRGYTMKNAFLWTITSSLAFEFTIETLTERPSYQDIFQTPAFGAALGMGAEYLSLHFHSKRTWPARALGYLLNPFTLLPISHYEFGVAPLVRAGHVGATVSMTF